MRVVNLDELDRWLASSPPPRVVDVRLDDDFQAGHLAGAVHACVFKMSFLEDVARLCPPDQPIVVYGAGATSHESRVAAEKLQRAGCQKVGEFRAGMEGWLAAGRPVEGPGNSPTSDPLQGTFSIDLLESRVEWTGRNLLNKHTGSVALRSGHATFDQDRLVSGDFTIDLRTISCSDITDNGMNRMLVEHLKSDDFFDVDRFPEARFQIRRVEPVPGAGPGLPNMRVIGDLTLRGQIKPLVLLAAAGRTPQGRLAAQAVFSFDRTLWGSIYGSGRYFHRLGMHLVNDLIEIQVRLLV